MRRTKKTVVGNKEKNNNKKGPKGWTGPRNWGRVMHAQTNPHWSRRGYCNALTGDEGT
jgi:hypothetical protein